MFTGIVQKVATVRNIRTHNSSARISLKLEELSEEINRGDSVMVDGVCLTATDPARGTWTFDVSSETLRRTTLGSLRPGNDVNVELAMRPTDRFGGHFVSGHVDGTGHIRQISERPGETRLNVEVTSELSSQMIMKGSVAVDGISLTVADLSTTGFEVSLIPHTLSATTLRDKKIGDRVNVECDMIGKWVQKLTTATQSDSEGLSMEQLRENGY